MARDSRAEARRAWRQMGKHKSMFNGWMLRADYNRAVTGILAILESLARREYEAGYAAGHEDQMRARVLDAMEAQQRASRPSPYDLDAIAADRARRRS